MTRLAPRLLAAVAAGGAGGAVLRHLLEGTAPGGADADGLPWTTLLVNVVGAGLLAALPLIGVVRRSQVASLGLGTGALGGFTTLGATSEQARALLAAGQSATAAAYLVLTLGAALLAVAAVSHVVGVAPPAPAGGDP